MGVFPDLFGRFEELVVGCVVVVFTVVSCVRTANARARLVGSAAMVLHEVLTISEYHQVPASIVDKDADPTMHHIPADVIVIFPCLRRLDRKCEVAAAASRAILTQNFSWPEIFSAYSSFHRAALGDV